MNDNYNVLIEYLTFSDGFYYGGLKRYSSLVAGLSDCRLCVGRNISGVYDGKNNGNPGNWLGTIGYFTILDQIGSCFKSKVNENVYDERNSIKRAIKEFGFDIVDNNEKYLDALVSLRNSFTHDFNLLNIPRDLKNVSQIHKFTVMADISSKWIVKLPKETWNMNVIGKDFNKTSDTTYINLYAFMEMVEEIYRRICLLAEDGNVELIEPIEYLLNKYSFIIS